MNVEILLTKPVENLGEPGDVVSVKRGFARNYLIPRGFAVEPTEHNKRGIQKVRESRLKELSVREEQAKALAKQLSGTAFTFTRKIHDDNKLYSTVRPEEIAEAISKQFGTPIERSRVQISAPIEQLGTYPVVINVYKGITAEIKVQVAQEGEKASGAALEGASAGASKKKPE